jgi:hypothetical protein
VPENKHVLIVASPRPRVGKTLVARILADHLTLVGEPRRLFDTDAAERRLSTFFPDNTTVVDLERVPDQMKLFDSLAAQPPVSQVIDLTHRSFAKFFKLVREIGYFAEAKAVGLEPVIFYIPDSEPDSYEQGWLCAIVSATADLFWSRTRMWANRAGRPLQNRSFLTLAGHSPNVALKLLDPFLHSTVEDVRLSLSDFAKRSIFKQAATPLPPDQVSLAYLSLEARDGIAGWLRPILTDIRLALRATDLQARVLAHDRFGE